MPSHEYFESLCGLATVQRIRSDQLADLLCHITDCKSCRDSYERSLLALERDSEKNHSTGSMVATLHGHPAAYRERFLNRARAEGLTFSEAVELEKSRDVWIWPRLKLQYGLALAAMISIATLGIWTYRAKTGQRTTSAELAAVHKESSILRRANTRLESELSADRLHRSLIDAQSSELSSKLSAMHRERSVTLARVQMLQQELKQDEIAEHNLASSAQASEAQRKTLSERLREQVALRAQMSDEVKKLRAIDANNKALIEAQDQHRNQLANELTNKTDLLDRESRLLAADRDVRNLMGARNLHVVDVYDADGAGNNRKAFGRVFYTEGKSLIFYAFDLGNPNKSDRNVSFVGWGIYPDARGPAKQLGIFYVDDAQQRRWVLKIDNPEVLREINAVFVTVEPARGSKRPTGQKLLYAYLETEANHP